MSYRYWGFCGVWSSMCLWRSLNFLVDPKLTLKITREVKANSFLKAFCCMVVQLSVILLGWKIQKGLENPSRKDQVYKLLEKKWQQFPINHFLPLWQFLRTFVSLKLLKLRGRIKNNQNAFWSEIRNILLRKCLKKTPRNLKLFLKIQHLSSLAICAIFKHFRGSVRSDPR